jgi:peptidoglycan/LPS O-acetylase OafA/YrhL
VFVYHYGGGAHLSSPVLRPIGISIHAGWIGVTLFFVLSGFLISGILWDGMEDPNWWCRFYIRRTLRIFPLYYASLLIVFFAAVLLGNWRIALSNLWVYALYLQNIPSFSVRASSNGSPLLLTHFWSLAVEEQFYLILPILLVCTRTLPQARRLCLAVFVFSALFRIVVWVTLSDPLSYAESLPARAGELAAGAYLAMWFRDPCLWRRIQAFAPAAMLVGGSCFLFVAITERSPNIGTTGMFIFGLPAITVFFTSLLALALGQGAVAALLGMAWLRWLGRISYGAYVFHVLLTPIFVSIVATIAPSASRIETLCLNCLVAAVLTLALAQVSFRFFEHPFLSLRERFRRPDPDCA